MRTQCSIRVRWLGRWIVTAVLFGVPMAAPAALVWTNIGPFGGDQFRVIISPQDTNTLFSMGHFGVHRSYDAAETWETVHSPGMSRGTVHDLAFCPTNADHVFIGSSVDGVWFSSDEGDTWVLRSNGLPYDNEDYGVFCPITSLIFDPDLRLFAGVGQGEMLGTVPTGLVYSSVDMGLSWTNCDSGLPAPVTNGTQEALALVSADAATQIWAMVYGSGVYIYSNGTWTSRNGDLPTNRCTYLAHDPQDADRLLLGTEDDWVYETTNGGSTWSALPMPSELIPVTPKPLIYAITIDPNNGDFLWVEGIDSTIGATEYPLFQPRADQTTGLGAYWTPDGGTTWHDDAPFHYRTAVDPSETVSDTNGTRSKTWYVTSGGFQSLMKSTNGSDDFEIKTHGIRSLLVNAVWVHPNPPPGYSNMLFVAAETGLSMRTNHVEQWSFAKAVKNIVYTWSFADDPTHPERILYSAGNPAWSWPLQRGIYRISFGCFSPTNVDTCSPSTNNLFPLLARWGEWKVVTSYADTNRVYGGGQSTGISLSPDAGVTWTGLNSGMGLRSITDIVLDTNGGPAYCSFRTSNGDPPNPWWPTSDEAGGVFRWDNTSTQWTRIWGLTAAVMDLEIVRGPSVTTLYAASVHGIYKTTNDSTWVSCSGDTIVNDLLIHPTNVNYMYGGTAHGVYRSTDRAESWHRLGHGMTIEAVNSLAFDEPTDILYAGTGGNSVFQLLPDTNPVPVLALNPTNVDFGPVPLFYFPGSPGGLYGERIVTVTNQGESTLVITNITTNSIWRLYDEIFPFLVTVDLPVTLTPGSSEAWYFRFYPAVTGPAETNIYFYSNDSNSPHVLHAEGVGYNTKGYLAVDVTPDTGQWTYYMPWGGHFSRTGDMVPPLGYWPTGTYTITWSEVAGYYPPTNDPVAATVAVGQTAWVYGVHTPYDQDTDGDWAYDWEEFVAGTDHTDPTSYFHIVDVDMDGGTTDRLVITWNSVTGRLYTVQQSTNLYGDFLTVWDWIDATPPMNAYTDLMYHLSEYFRVKVREK